MTASQPVSEFERGRLVERERVTRIIRQRMDSIPEASKWRYDALLAEVNGTAAVKEGGA